MRTKATWLITFVLLAPLAAFPADAGAGAADTLAAGEHEHEGALVLEGDLQIVPRTGAKALVLEATGPIRIAGRLIAPAATRPGEDGLDLILRAPAIAILPGALLRAGDGADGAPAEGGGSAPIRAGDGGRGGNILLVTDNLTLEGTLRPGDAGHGGQAISHSAQAHAFGGAGGAAGTALQVQNGEQYPLATGRAGDGGDALATPPAAVTPPRTPPMPIGIWGLPGMPDGEPIGGPGGIAIFNGSDGGDSVYDGGHAKQGADGADGESGFFSCTAGGDGGNGGPGGPAAAATGGPGGLGILGGGGEGGQGISRGGNGGSGGNGGHGGRSIIAGSDCAGGAGGNGGAGGSSGMAKGGRGGDSICSAAGAGGNAESSGGSGGAGGAGGSGVPEGPAGLAGPAGIPGSAVGGEAGLSVAQGGCGVRIPLPENIDLPGMPSPGCGQRYKMPDIHCPN